MTGEIQRADTGDVDAMGACVHDAYRHYIRRMGKVPGPMLDDYAYRVENNHTYVIKSHDRVIALLVLIEDENGMLLDNIAVHPDAQGQGIGKKLMAFAEDLAVRSGYTRITLYTHVTMTESFEMYKQLGYVVSEKKTVDGYQRIYMEKALEKPKTAPAPLP